MPSPGRPPGDAPVANPNNLLRWLAFAPLFLSGVVAKAQPQSSSSSVLQRHSSPHESLRPESIHSPKLEATKIPKYENPVKDANRKKTLSVDNEQYPKNDASAIATLAPATSAVAAPFSRPTGISTAGLASRHIARSLEDWEVEDFVLLATIDGKLHAKDRKTGRERWVVEAANHVVNSTHYHHTHSPIDEDYTPLTIDDYIWAIEPTHDGSIYIYRRNGESGTLVPTGLTMKKLVESAPYTDADPAVTYTGEKKTSMLVIDAHDGTVVKYFGSAGPIVKDQICLNTNGLSRKDTECKTSPTFTIGRTEYTVSINGVDGHLIAQLSFSEWVPNKFDDDLQIQYHTSLDNKYIYTTSNGEIFGMDHDKKLPHEQGRKLFKHKLSSPVVRIFDVARPWAPEKDGQDLIVLSQPTPPLPSEDSVSANDRERSIFLNQTENGSWFALSGKHYPTAVQGAKPALCESQGWLPDVAWDSMNDGPLSKALVGLHSIEKRERYWSNPMLTLAGSNENHSAEDTGLVIPPDPSTASLLVLGPVYLLRDYLLQLAMNPLVYTILAFFAMVYFREMMVAIRRVSKGEKLSKIFTPSIPSDVQVEKPADIKEPTAGEPDKIEVPAVKVEPVEDPKTNGDAGKVLKLARTDSLEVPSDEAPAPAPVKPEKKKAHRGQRGGVKHKKGRNRAASQDGSRDPKPPATVEDAVRDAQKLGEQPKLEPDIHTISHDPSEVSGPIIRVGDLVVNTEKLIGTGSNGTMVFEGNFDGRDVAVKRMLIQFFDIASQETKLLRESDDHPNVIRYYAQQQAAGFLYIALELCPASLADIISKPALHPDLVRSGERDLPNVLYQIANGLQHLHTLRIVHRDLKPQNILVSMGKDGRPRLLVSDFGLCKKLEGEQSSFRATTAHAAGTTGWRAPELLIDDDAKIGSSMVDASTNGDSGSGVLVSPELMPNRRATRAIDIFSLGLVFFYVLTKGGHPFNSGGQWMREVNIRKGVMDLSPLDVLGDYAYEAKSLISSMLSAEPRERPNARDVMSHPFFWSTKKRLNFLCDVSDHFEKECRDPPSPALLKLEDCAGEVCRADFLKVLPRDFVDSLGKQRKYTGTRLLDLLRALRNKKNHYEDMSDKLKKEVGPLPDGYLFFWTTRFSNLLITCWNVVYEVQWDETDRFRDYYLPAGA